MPSYSLEEDLVNSFSKKSGKLLRSLGVDRRANNFLIHEFDSRFGVADLVMGTYSKTSWKDTARYCLNENWIEPLASLEEKSVFSFDDFRVRFGTSVGLAKRQLGEYQRAGFVARTPDGRYVLSKSYRPITKLVVSVEAKLRNWRKALLQAVRYKKFSDYSFVLLDKDQAGGALLHLESFRANNVGLILMKPASFEVIITPPKNVKKGREYSLRLNEVVVRSLNARTKAC
jgi:hypothetical protein